MNKWTKLIVIITVWMEDLHHHCLFPTAGFCHHSSLIFVAFQHCKFFTAQNLLSNLSVKCLVYKLVPAILINSSLFLFLHKLMDEKLYKSEKKNYFPQEEGLQCHCSKQVSRLSHLPEIRHSTTLSPEAYLVFLSLFFFNVTLSSDWFAYEIKGDYDFNSLGLEPWGTKATSTATYKLQVT